MSGLIADSRTMVDKARVEAQVNWVILGKGFVIEGHKIWDWWLIYVIRTSQCNCDDYTLFWKSNFPYDYMWMLLLLFFFVIIVESLVHIQWEDECGKCHTSCFKPCTWVWRWWCQRRSNGKEVCSPFLKSNNFIKCLYKWVKLHDQWWSVYGVFHCNQIKNSMIGNACKTVSASVASNSSNKVMINCSRHCLYLLNSWYIKGREVWWWWRACDNFLINFPIRKKRKLLFHRIKTKSALFWNTLTIRNEILCSIYT